jgi:ATP synthase protein I
VALRPRASATGWGRALEAGIQFAASIGVGMAIGYYADRWLGTGPWLLFLFLAFGFAAGLRNLLRLAPGPGGSSDGK